MPRSRSEIGRRIDRRLVRWAAQCGVGLLRHLSVRNTQRLGDMLGSLMISCWPSRQRMADRNIAAVFGDRLTADERRRIRTYATRNAAKTVLELLRMQTATDEEFDDLVSTENPELLAEALAEGRGVVAATPHFGNWELLAASGPRGGHNTSVVARDSDDPETASIINRARESTGLKVIGRSQVREMLRVLRAGGILGIVPDQRVSEGGVMADFMGRPARTPTGPASLAARTGSPIMPCFGRRTEDDRIVCYYLPPIRVPDTGDREADILAATQMLNDVLGREIMKYPGQWLWLHNRWRVEEKQEAQDGSSAPK